MILIVIIFTAIFGLLFLISKYESTSNSTVKRNKPSRSVPRKVSREYILSSDIEKIENNSHLSANQKEAIRLVKMLLDIYTPKNPFMLKVSQRKPKRRMGTYFTDGRRIVVYEGWKAVNPPEKTAIHELAHHIHLVEQGGLSRKERVHGPQFKKINNELKKIAVRKGYLNSIYL